MRTRGSGNKQMHVGGIDQIGSREMRAFRASLVHRLQGDRQPAASRHATLGSPPLCLTDRRQEDITLKPCPKRSGDVVHICPTLRSGSACFEGRAASRPPSRSPRFTRLTVQRAAWHVRGAAVEECARRCQDAWRRETRQSWLRRRTERRGGGRVDGGPGVWGIFPRVVSTAEMM